MYYRINDAEMVEIVNGLGAAGNRLSDLAAAVKNPAPVEWVQRDLAAVRRVLSEAMARGYESDIAAEALAEARACHDLAAEAVDALEAQR